MKIIIREAIAMVILVAAILLIIIMAFFDYIQDASNIPVAKSYARDKDVRDILESKGEFEKETNTITLSSSSLTVDASMLNQYIASRDLRQGQSTPFDELAITRIEYDQAGNAYYKVSADTQVNGFNYGSSVSGDTTNTTTINNTVTNTTVITNNADTATQDQPLYTTPNSGK